MAENILHIILDAPGDIETTSDGAVKATKTQKAMTSDVIKDSGKALSGSGANQALATSNKADNGKSFATGALGALGVHTVMQLGSKVASTYVASVGTIQSNATRQNSITNLTSECSTAGGILSAGISGAVAGSFLGPAGSAVGAAIAVAGAVAVETVGAVEKNAEWQIENAGTLIESNRQTERLGRIISNKNR